MIEVCVCGHGFWDHTRTKLRRVYPDGTVSVIHVAARGSCAGDLGGCTCEEFTWIGEMNMSYDDRCLQLAAYFLESTPDRRKTINDLHRLAETIQTAVEDFLGCLPVEGDDDGE